jgi:nanoRNase/pAp phosphatase (c-di-AMP/oligoRNAs hydrolase)
MTSTPQNLLAIPEPRRTAIRRLDTFLLPGTRVAISTHVNADGDGCGPEVALARLLLTRGMKPVIVNPTPWPRNFAFPKNATCHSWDFWESNPMKFKLIHSFLSSDNRK